MFSIASFASFGVGGARRPSAFCSGAAGIFVALLLRSGVDPAQVFTSCGAGAPALAAAAFPGCHLFSASDFPGLGRAAYAARAAALVRGLAAAPSPLWACFPGCECPAGVAPSRQWVSCGSGSWSECSLAAGLGVPVLVFLRSGMLPPVAFGGWSAVAAAPGGEWWFLPAAPGLFEQKKNVLKC